MDAGHRFAAIDIGSNAIRMLFARVLPNPDGDPCFAKESMFRMPLRLGADTFSREKIKSHTADRLVQTLAGFHHLIEAYDPVDWRACATSAMRRARNGEDLVKRIRRETGVKVRLISGEEEARLIFANHVEARLDRGRNYVYIDVGGGSTEITLISARKPVRSRSFPVGSVRLLTGHADPKVLEEMLDWVRETTHGIRRPRAIGSGGNINKIFSLVGAKRSQAISYGQIEAALDRVSGYSVEDRVRVLGLRPDRADVIDYAAHLYLAVMEAARARKMYVPQVGLVDGLVREMYREFVAAP